MHFFFNENVRFSIKIPLKFVSKCPINNIPALVQIMALCRPGDKSLSEPMVVRLLMHMCITRPQWVYVETGGRQCLIPLMEVSCCEDSVADGRKLMDMAHASYGKFDSDKLVQNQKSKFFTSFIKKHVHSMCSEMSSSNRNFFHHWL